MARIVMTHYNVVLPSLQLLTIYGACTTKTFVTTSMPCRIGVRRINSWEKPSVQTVLMPLLRDTRLLPIPSYASTVQPYRSRASQKWGNTKKGLFLTNELAKHGNNTFHTTSSLHSQIRQCQKPWGAAERLGAAQEGYKRSRQKKNCLKNLWALKCCSHNAPWH